MSSVTRRTIIAGAAGFAMVPAPAPASPRWRESHLNVPGGRLWHIDSGGSGRALIFVHPGTGGHESWVHQRDVFAQAGFRVITYSRWGYAPSDPAPRQRRPEMDDLRAVLDALRIGQTDLVGVAAGAGIVAPFVATHPGRVRKAALVSSLLGISDGAIEAAIERLRPPGFAALPAEFRELGPSYRAASPDGVENWLRIERGRPAPPPPEARTATTLAALAASRRPLLLATGDADLFTPPALLRLAAARLPNATYRTIDDAGHAPFWEQPAAFNRLVLAFLRA